MRIKSRDGESHKNYKSLWLDGLTVKVIDQRKLPFSFNILELKTAGETLSAIRNGSIQGSISVAVASAYAVAQAASEFDGSAYELFRLSVYGSADILTNELDCPNVSVSVEQVLKSIKHLDSIELAKKAAFASAEEVSSNYIDVCKRIGLRGGNLITTGSKILIHCNGGALGSVDFGTSLAPIRSAKILGRSFQVYIDKDCPGSNSWELSQEGISVAAIPPLETGHIMRSGEIDFCMMAAEKADLNGDVYSSPGTYEKAVLSKEHSIPFYVALPRSSVDTSGKKFQEDSGFVPSEYITAYITEYGMFRPGNFKDLMQG
ncbi:MAG: hypothetical protein CL963_03705 [Euryarchaeota archaeon]|jgi:methylthioribose-1-phosphate isomerase|nr:hypothetical protein [Euryarchaeota archaeon]|tara:strand:- start:27559 stop:28512 length:954 start_codon:yes stop_codon:yes gene_type:complete